MSNYFEDLVQNIYTNCDMRGFEDYNRGVQNLTRMTNQSARERIRLHELEQKSQIRLNEYQEKYAIRKAKRDQAEIGRLGRINGLWRGAVRLIGAYFGIQTLRNIVRTGTEIQLIERSITGLTGSTQDFKFLDQQAFKFGLSLKTVATGYKNFYSSAKMAGFQPGQIQNMFSDMLLGARSIGASDQQIGGALLALEQMMSKGRVSMEELRRQLGNALPGAFEIGAKAMGVTTAKFNELVKAGISANEFVPKFIKTFKEQYQKGWADVEQTVSVAQGRLKESWEMFTFEIMHGEAGKELAKGLNLLANVMRTPEFLRFVKILSKIFTLIIKIFEVLIKNLKLTIALAPLVAGGFLLMSNALEVLGAKGVLAFTKLTKASLVLYSKWIILFALLTLIQDLLYGIFMPSTTDSLTEDLLKKLGLYPSDEEQKQRTRNKIETATERDEIERRKQLEQGIVNPNTGTMIYVDKNGRTWVTSNQTSGLLETFKNAGENNYGRHAVLAPTQLYPQAPTPYIPSSLTKVDSQSMQMGDINITIQASERPYETAKEIYDMFFIYGKQLEGGRN